MAVVILANCALVFFLSLIRKSSGQVPMYWKMGSGVGWLLFVACDAQQQQPAPPITVGFYHWQQRLVLDSLPQCWLTVANGTELPAKIMDIGWENDRPSLLFQLDIPPLDTAREAQRALRLLPVVFITNEVMLRASQAELLQLADDILQAAQRMLPSSVWEKVGEWQFDCDWTAKSKEAYFYFLQQLRTRLPAAQSISATVRLHQYAHPAQQGVPPVDRAVLMAYNMGELQDPATVNSILDTNISKQYLLPKHRYPLPLDIALPYYQWGAIYREASLVYLSNELAQKDLADSSRFKPLGTLQYQVVRPTYLGTYYLYANDFIRLEGVEEASLHTLAKQLSSIPAFPGQRLLFYHLGSQRAAACQVAEIEKVVAVFNSR